MERKAVFSSDKYKNPYVDIRNIIPMELYINFNAPIILVEGIFDALTIKRNVIPLFGKVIHEQLMKRLMESKVNRIYICLDKDAEREAIKYAEELMGYNKEIYLVELDGKDPNEIGFSRFLEIIEDATPITFQSLLNKKLERL